MCYNAYQDARYQRYHDASKMPFSGDCINKWQKAPEVIKGHKNSKDHMNAANYYAQIINE